MTKPNAAQRRKPLDPARQAAFDVLRAVSETDAYANLALPATAARPRNHRPRRRVRDRTHLRHLPHPRPARRGHRRGRRTSAGPDRPGAAGPAAAGHLSAAAHPCRTRTPRCPPPSSRPGIEFDSARAGFVNGVLRTISGRDEQSWVDELAPTPPNRPRRARGVRACSSALDRPGFRRRARRRAGQLDALLASDDERPLVHLAARPGVLTAEELAEQVDGDGRPLLAVCGVPVRRRSGQARRRSATARRSCRTRAASWWHAR